MPKNTMEYLYDTALSAVSLAASKMQDAVKRQQELTLRLSMGERFTKHGAGSEEPSVHLVRVMDMLPPLLDEFHRWMLYDRHNQLPVDGPDTPWPTASIDHRCRVLESARAVVSELEEQVRSAREWNRSLEVTTARHRSRVEEDRHQTLVLDTEPVDGREALAATRDLISRKLGRT